jgi:hypothetical protein
VTLPDGSRLVIEPIEPCEIDTVDDLPSLDTELAQLPTVTTQPSPLGLICGGRSGDKGGNANVGLWTRDSLSYEWLAATLTVERFKEILPEAAELTVRRFELPNLRALNFVVVGLLGEGVASSARPDPQAKSLAERIRAHIVDTPVALLDDASRRAPAASVVR